MTDARPYPVGTRAAPGARRNETSGGRGNPAIAATTATCCLASNDSPTVFERVSYGRIEYAGEAYELYALSSRPWDAFIARRPHHRRGPWVRNQRRHGRAGVSGDPGGGLRRAGQSARRRHA